MVASLAIGVTVWRSWLGLGAVPVTGASGASSLISSKTMLEVIEDGELFARHDIVVRLGLDLAPDVGNGLVEDLANSRV